MRFILTTATALAGAALANGSPLPGTLFQRVTGLQIAANALGKYFGTATHLPDDDERYMEILNHTGNFGQVTPENAMKWDATEPSRNTFSFTAADEIAAYASEKGSLLRCHTLVWYNQLPSWVSSGGFDNSTLIDIMTNHIAKVVGRYKGQCDHWDVVNEALNEDGTYRENVFYTTIGEAYIPLAFQAAADADPDAKLFYNDYNIEWSGSKATAAANIVKLVQSYGAKIDGVGMQSHFTVGNTASQSAIEGIMGTYVDLGVDVAITELDIRMEFPITDAKKTQQKTDYETVVGACVNVDGCLGITVWQFTDKYSWVPDTFSGYGAALPWGKLYNKKPAFEGILVALEG